jgi:hypothetical protein
MIDLWANKRDQCVWMGFLRCPGSRCMTNWTKDWTSRVFLSCCIVSMTLACGTDSPQRGAEVSTDQKQISFCEENDAGERVCEYDTDGDGSGDIIKKFVHYTNPDDPSVRKSRMISKEVDLNSDGKMDVLRKYNEFGAMITEDLDMNLDGRFDMVNYFDNNTLVRRELLNEETGAIVARQFYHKSELLRVERDRDGNQKMDYWEFYEAGTLDRIGTDIDGDERADVWQSN